ncbi:PGU1 Endopygalactorunase [Candidatus Nanopelagicaceae bacterium]
MDISIDQCGAIADGLTLNSSVIQGAIDEISAAGGGRLTIPKGVFLSGSLQIKAGVELHLAEGAVLLASSRYEDYSEAHSIPAITEGAVDEYVLPQRAFISGFKAHQAAITGTGTIDGNANNFIEERGRYIHSMRGPVGGKSQYLERPFTVFIIESDNLALADFTLKDPAFWAIRITGCDHSAIERVKILTDLMVPNADGIDIDRCSHVLIKDCTLITADDCISLKSCAGTAQYGDVSFVTIENCYMKTTSGAITLGTESVGDIRDILVENCTVEDSHRGFAVRAREGGTISNCVFRNSTVKTRAFSPMWWGHGEALHVTAFSWNDPGHVGDGNPERALEGYVRNIRFENLEVDTEAGILNWAARPELIEGVQYIDIRARVGSRSKWDHRIDLRPNDIQNFVERPHCAIEVVNSTNVTFEGCEVTWDKGSREKYGQLIHTESAPGLEFAGIKESIA